MDRIFEVIDKTGRKIKLSSKTWKHIKKHSHMDENRLEEIKMIVKNPQIKSTMCYLGLKQALVLWMLKILLVFCQVS